MNPRNLNQGDFPPGTILESDDEIKRIQEQLRKGSTAKESVQERIFLPTFRPPAATLVVCDDGKNTGEIIRIRNDQFIIGRYEGDFKLPFDELLSPRHLAVNRQLVSGKWRWIVTDLQSKNAVFFRVAKAPLQHGCRFLVGKGCYKFEFIPNSQPETSSWVESNHALGTTKYSSEAKTRSASITEITQDGNGLRLKLEKPRYSIGTNIGCDIVRANDPFTAPEHAVLTRSTTGKWLVENNRSLNGVWVSLTQLGIAFGSKCEFQAGEQRFRLGFGVDI